MGVWGSPPYQVVDVSLNILAEIVTCSLLKAAEEVHLPKTLRLQYGGGLKEFVQQEISYFEGTENEREFFTTQERQWLVLHLLQTLRAGPDDQVGGLKLIEGQAIGL
jgi:anoctamin-8